MFNVILTWNKNFHTIYAEYMYRPVFFVLFEFEKITENLYQCSEGR